MTFITIFPILGFRLRGADRENVELCTTFLEIKLPHALLQDGSEVFVSPCNNRHATSAQVWGVKLIFVEKQDLMQ